MSKRYTWYADIYRYNDAHELLKGETQSFDTRDELYRHLRNELAFEGINDSYKYPDKMSNGYARAYIKHEER